MRVFLALQICLFSLLSFLNSPAMCEDYCCSTGCFDEYEWTPIDLDLIVPDIADEIEKDIFLISDD